MAFGLSPKKIQDKALTYRGPVTPPAPQWTQFYTQPIPQATKVSGPQAVMPTMQPFVDQQQAQRAAPAPTSGGGYDGGYGGGYSSGGGGYSDGYGASATPNIGQDPAYLAFLRALGIEKADLGQSAEDRISVINREIARRLPDILQAGEYAREGIDGNFESRGVFRSGKRIETLGRQRADEGRQVGALQGAAADQVFLINQELSRRQAAIDRQLAEQSLTSAGNVYQ